jgi:hypothetical protein
MAPAGLAERESEQARAQQHEARRCQRQESAGNIITITHFTPAVPDPAVPDAGPNYLKISQSAFERGPAPKMGSGPRPKAFKRMGNKNTGAKQAQKRRNRLNHRKNPLRPCREQNDMPGRTVKRIPGGKRKSHPTDDLAQQLPAGCRPLRHSTARQSNQSFTTSALSPFPPPSGCGMFIRCCGSGLHLGTSCS